MQSVRDQSLSGRSGYRANPRRVAKRIHPDLATDESERQRRHELMTEANRACEKSDQALVTSHLIWLSECGSLLPLSTAAGLRGPTWRGQSSRAPRYRVSKAGSGKREFAGTRREASKERRTRFPFFVRCDNINGWREAAATDDPNNAAHFVAQGGLEGIRDISANSPVDLPCRLNDCGRGRQSRHRKTDARHGLGRLRDRSGP